MRIFTRIALLLSLFAWTVGFLTAQVTQPKVSTGSQQPHLTGSSGHGAVLPLQFNPTTQQYDVGSDQEKLTSMVQWAQQARLKPRGTHSWIPQSQVVFRPNVGQIVGTDGNPQPQIKYEVVSRDLNLYFAKDRISYVFNKFEDEFWNKSLPLSDNPIKFDKEASNKAKQAMIEADKQGKLYNFNPLPLEAKPIMVYQERIDLEFVGANPNAELIGEKEAGSHVNYYLGALNLNKTNVPNYRMIVYKNIYPNIDLVFYGASKGIKYDFVIHPGGNPNDIKLKYVGAQSVSINEKGSLVVKGKYGELVEDKPFSFQEITNENRFQKGTCESRFVQQGDAITFQVDGYDPSRLLVIDPTIAWSQMYGGTRNDYATAIAVDNQDQAHITGLSFSLNFPTQNPNQAQNADTRATPTTPDAFVTKFMPTGQTTGTWSTYYGGGFGANAPTTFDLVSTLPCVNNGALNFATFNITGLQRGWDIGSDIKIDPYGNSVVIGTTNSANLPMFAPGNETATTLSGFFDVFVAQFGQGGGITWSRFYGGTGNEGAGNMPSYFAGNNAQCAQINGIFDERQDAFTIPALAIDPNGDVVITGATNSDSIPLVNRSYRRTRAGQSDVFVSKISNLGFVQWSTFIGGASWDWGTGIATDGAGNIFVTGGSFSDDYPIYNAFQEQNAGFTDGIITKLAPDSRILMSSYYGADFLDNAIISVFAVLTWRANVGDVDIDPFGDPVIANFTQSDNGIATTGAFSTTLGSGLGDAYLAKISTKGGLGGVKWGTYLGGAASADFAYNIEHYADGKIGIAGSTFSNNFPTVTPLQGTQAGSQDGFFTIMKSDGTGPLVYSTLVGGPAQDILYGITIAPNGTTYLAGRSASTNTFLAPAFSPLAAPRNATSGGDDALVIKFTEPTAPTANCTGTFTNQPIKVGILKYKVDLTMEYPNTLAALDSKFKNYILTEFTNPDDITAGALAGIDVLIIPEIEDPTVDYTLFTTLGTRLNTWVTAGGTVIFLGSNNRIGLNNGTFANVIFNTGLLAGNQAAHSRLVEPAIIRDQSTCLTDRLPNLIFQSPNVTTYTITSGGFTNVLNPADPTSIGVRTLGTGKVFLLGMDYESYDDYTAQLLANAVACYQNTAGRRRMEVSYKVKSASCRLRNDGAIDLSVQNAPGPVTYNWSIANTITQDVSGLTAGNYTVTISAGSANACREIVRITVPGCDSLNSPSTCPKMNPDPIINPTRTPAIAANDTISYCRTNPPTAMTITTNDSTKWMGCGDYFIQTTPHVLPVVAAGKGDTIDITQEFFNTNQTQFSNFNTYENVGLGFPFNYYCNQYRNVGLNLNGFLSFNQGENGNNLLPQRLPSDTVANNILAFHWVQSMVLDNQGDPFPGTSIRYIRDTTARKRRFIAQYQNIRYLDYAHFQTNNPPAASTAKWSATVVLYEGDSIDVFITLSEAKPNFTGQLGAPFFQNPTNVTIRYPKTMALENESGKVGKAIVAGRNQSSWSVTTPEGYRIRPFAPANTLRYRWFVRNITNNGLVQIAGATQRNLTVNPIPTDSSRYIIQIQHGDNCFFYDSVQVNVDRPTVPGQVTRNDTVCPGGSVTLTATGFTGQIVRWESATDNGFTQNVAPIALTTTTITRTNIQVTTFYRAVIRNGDCADAFSTPAQISVLKPDIGTPTIRNVSCNGGVDGSITVPVTSGSPTYTFSWFRGANVNGGTPIPDSTRATLANQRAGIYSVIVIDRKSCRDTLNNITLTEPSRITPTLLRREDVLCAGGSDGVISLRVTGGTRPYTYRFTGEINPTLDSIRTNLRAGCYTITITDANNCQDSLVNICLFQPTPIVIRTPIKRDVSCNGGNDGHIQLDVSGGVPNYRFTWNPPVSTNEDARNLTAGTYVITIRDRNGSGCAKDTTVTITQPGVLFINQESLKNVSCFGAKDGSIRIDAQGGTQPYQIAWGGPGVTQQDQNREDLLNRQPGTYCVTITDAKNCTVNRCFVITEPQPLRLIFTDLVAPKCATSADGCATAVALGGNGGYQITWAFDGSTQPTNCTLRGNRPYEVTVIDANNCSLTQTVTLTAPQALDIAVKEFKNVTCKGANNGLINIDIAGGTPPFTYDWVDLNVPNEPEDRQNLAPNAIPYCITVTDANGCKLDRCFTITEPNAITITILNQKNPTCKGKKDGLIDVSVTGGNPGTKTFRWTREGNTFPNNTLEDVRDADAGNYLLTVTDSLGCTGTLAVTLTEPDELKVVLVQKTDNKCFGECSGVINVDFAGGTQPYLYTWEDNPNAPEDRNNLCANDYVVNVLDFNGCTARLAVTITQPQQLAVQLNRLTNVTCNKTCNGVIDIQPTGGVPPYTYRWNTTPSQTSQDINNACASDTVKVTVIDANQCQVTRTFKITQPDSMTITVVKASRPTCNGFANGAITISVTGGTKFNNPAVPYRFLWTRNGAFTSSNQNLTNLAFGNYCVTVTDANGCIKTQCVNLTQPSALTVTIQVNETVKCPNGKTGIIEAMPTGGTPPYTYTWNSNNSFNTKILSNAGAGGYTVVTSDSNGCLATAAVTLTQPAPIAISVLNKTNILCNGDRSGAIEVAVVGGTSPYTYLWKGDQLNPPVNTAEEPRITDLLPGTYEVEVTDANGCKGTLTGIIITQPQQGISITTITRTDVTCNGKKDGRLTIRPIGGTGELRAEWAGPGVNTVGTSLRNLGPGTYCVTVSDQVNCTKQECYTITEPAEFKLDTTNVKHVSCAGANDGSITVQTSGGNNGQVLFAWVNSKNNNIGSANSVSNLVPDVYTACALDRLGCQTCIQIVITEPLPITLKTQKVTGVPCNGQASGSIEVEAEGGGTGVFQYNWSGPNGYSGSGATISGLKGGEYVLVVTKGNCNQEFRINVAEPGALIARLREKRDVTCNGGSNGSINLDIEGGTEPYTFNWTPTSPNIEDINQLQAGEYSLVVTDKNGCTANFTTTITEPDPVQIVLQGIIDVQCHGEAMGGISVNVSGGTAPYRYVWSTNNPADTTNVISDKPAGEYKLTVFDVNNCPSEVASFEIKQPDVLKATVTAITPESCKGAMDGGVQIAVTGGTQPIRYVWTFNNNPEDTTTVSNSTVDKVDLEPGAYNLLLIGTGGCTYDTTIVIPAADSMRITVDQLIQPICGESCTGRILLTIDGGVAPYTYIWQDNGAPASEDRDLLCEGTYCLRIIDANNCQKDTCFVLVNQGGEAIITGLPENVCSGDAPITLSATPSGGTFSGEGIDPVNNNLFNPALVTGASTTISYSVTVDGCEFRKEQIVNVRGGGIQAEITYTGFPAGPPFCVSNAGFYILSYKPIQTGITAQFSGPGVTFNGVSYLFTPAAAKADSHEIVLTLVDNLSQCRTVVKDTILVSSPASVEVKLDKNNICPGDSVTISVPGATSFSVSPTTGLACAPNCNNLTEPVKASPRSTTNYLVSANTGGCSVQKQVRVNVINLPAIVISASATSVCAGTEVNLKAVSAGTYTYKWSPGNLFTDSTGANVIARPTETTTFTVTGIASNGCKQTFTQQITVIPSQVTVTTANDTICLGASTTLTATSVQPGEFTFTWSPATGLSATSGATVTASPKVTTVYTVTRSGSGNCRTNTVRVAVRDTVAIITGWKAIYCVTEGCSDLTATPTGGTFSGTGVTGSQFCPTTAGVGTHTIRYSVTQGGCNINGSVTVVVTAPKPTTIINILPTYCRLANPVTLTPEIPGSEIKVKGVVTNILDPGSMGLGDWPVVVTPPANSGCVKDSIYTVRIIEPNTAIVGLAESYCLNSPCFTLTGTPAGGQFVGKGVRFVGGVYQFCPSSAGMGSASITYFGRDAQCTYSITRIVMVGGNLTATASVTNATSPTANDGKITITAQGGTPPYRYGLCGQPTNTNSTISGLLPGTYCVQVVAGSCSTTVNVTVGAGNLECSPPANGTVVASSITNNSVVITWGAVPNALSYVVDYRVVGAPQPISVPSASTSTTITQLTCNTNYEVVVRAICSNGGISPNTNAITFRTTECAVVGCPTPTNLRATLQTANSVRLSWTPVIEAINGYVVSWREDPNGLFRSTNVSGGNTSQFDVRNLVKGKKYCFRIRSRCANNVLSPFSDLVCLTIPQGKESNVIAEEPTDISIYPNPNKGQFTITLYGNQSEEATLSLFDVNGKQVWNNQVVLNEGINEIHYSEMNLSSGVYILRYILAGSSRTIKVVIE